MNEMSLLTLVVTDACNFNCTYCPQVKGNHYLSKENASAFIDFFYPYLKDECSINFYGGEPLLALDTIRYVVDLVKKKNKHGKKKVKFQLSTNGALLDDKIIRFLVQNDFSFIFSFDGLAQDIGRKKDTFDLQVAMIRNMAEYPTIRYEVNSVFSAETVGHLADSLKLIHSLNAKEMMLSIDNRHPWNEEQIKALRKEMKELAEFCFEVYRKEGRIPVINFRSGKKKGIFACNAGRDRMSIHPEGNMWGCYIFNDFFLGKENSPEYRQYSFGKIADFVLQHLETYARTLANYDDFRQYEFRTEKGKYCFLCNDLYYCSACPAMSGQVTGTLGMVPDWVCCINKVEKTANAWFQKKIGK